MITNKNGHIIQVFTPTEGTTLVTPYTPEEDETVVLAAECTITLDGVAVVYPVSSVIGLAKGVEYTLSASTSVHRMK